MEKYALYLSSNNRISSACVVLPKGNYEGMIIVDSIPEKNITDYYYIDNQFIYDPLPKFKRIKRENYINKIDIIESQITYTAMMTDTLLEV